MVRSRTLLVLLALSVVVSGLAVASPAAGQFTLPEGVNFPDEVVDNRAPANGCGSQGDDGTDVPDEVPGASFTDACNWHDRCYGTKGLSQSYCDYGMLARTRQACDGALVCNMAADVYYLAVAALGEGPYRDGQEAACPDEPRRNGRTHGDPHMLTLDGLAYSFMAAGEFAVIRDADGSDLVQSRYYPQTEAFTVVTGLAVRLGDREVVIQVNEEIGDPVSTALTVRIDGEHVTRSLVTLDEGLVEVGVPLPGANQVVSIRRWDGFQVDAVVYPGRMDLSFHVPEPLWGTLSGLLGDADGDPGNDLIDRNGTIITGADIWEGVYDEDFVEHYRLAPNDSMFIADGGFDYHADDIDQYPHEFASILGFSDDEIEAARATCVPTGLDGALLDACVFDVLFSGDPAFADTAATSAARAERIEHPGGPHDDEPAAVARPDAPTLDQVPLIDAALVGDIDEVTRLLDEGAEIDAVRTHDQTTALGMALLARHDAVVDLLLDRGADPNRTGDGQLSPLHLAAMTASADHVARLLDAGADVDSSGADELFTPLGVAAGSGDIEIARLLLDAGADIEGPATMVSSDGTPLYFAAGQADSAMVEFLLGRGADPNGQWDDGAETGPLFAAALSLRVEVVRILLRAGADPGSATPGDTDPAMFFFDEEILDLLDG